MAARVEQITEAEVLAALAAAAPGNGPEEARTQTEIAKASGVGVKKVREAMQILKAQGRLMTHRVTRTRLDDTTYPCSAFTILPPPTRRRR